MPRRSGIGDARRDGLVHRAEQVHDLLVAPVGVDRLLVGAPAAGAAAVVHREHDVAVGGEELAVEAERVLVLAVRPAVDVEQRRVLLPGRVGGRLDDQAVDDGAVLALRGEVLVVAELELGQQGVVLT